MIRKGNIFLGITLFFIAGSFLYSYFLEINYIRLKTILILLFFPFLVFFTKVYFQVIEKNYKKTYNYNPNIGYDLPNLNLFLKFNVLLSVIYFIFFLKINLDNFDILSIPRQISFKRYTDSLLMPQYLKILRIFVTISSIIAVFEYNRIKSMLSIFAISLIIFDGLMSSGKAGPLQGMILCFFTHIGINKLYLKRSITIKRYKLIFSSVGLFLFLFLTQVSRLDKFNLDIVYYIIVRLFGYAFAGINAFDIWLNELYFPSEKLYGALTFSGFFDFIGLKKRVAGVFTEGVVFADQPPTNIFTGFRFLIMDFGYVGSLIFICILFLMLNYIVNRIKIKSYHLIPLYSFISSYFVWIFFASLFSYNTYIISISIITLVLFWKRRITYR